MPQPDLENDSHTQPRIHGRFTAKKNGDWRQQRNKLLQLHQKQARDRKINEIRKLNIEADHTYAGDGDCETDNDSFKDRSPNVEGARIIDVKSVAKQLHTGCLVCEKPLELVNIDSEKRAGIASVFSIECDECGAFTPIHTSKRHLPEGAKSKNEMSYDLNTKAAVGMYHAGIGPTHVNAFLTPMNVPPVAAATLTRRGTEAGSAIEDVANRSCKDVIEAEKQAQLDRHLDHTTDEETPAVVDLTVSYDMGWQKRGRAHNSLTGVGAVMGVHTGKVMDYATCNKRCHQCQTTERLGLPAKEHNCRANYTGSSKSMEANVAQTLFQRAPEGVAYKTLVGDDDSSTIHKLHSEVDDTITKVSDIQHAKRSLEGQLLKIKPQYKELTESVIKYIKVCFAYAVTQNKDDPDGLAKALTAIPHHAYGEHTSCNPAWCNFGNDENYKHKSLPRGENLHDVKRKAELVRILGNFAQNADKLAPNGSSQRNEAFNNTVGSKAPKIRHYGGSASNDFRVSAAVSQKNLGYSYVPQVMETLNLSPGKYCSLQALRMDQTMNKQKQRSKLPAQKRKRLARRASRSSAQRDRETREGVQYQSGIGFSGENQDYTQIPDATTRPELETLDDVTPENIIVFDLETSSSGADAELTQIAATPLLDESGGQDFAQYILPEGQISPAAMNVTGLTINRRAGKRVLCHNGKEVSSISILEALQAFFRWLKDLKASNKFVLVAQNCKAFDMRHLVRQVVRCGSSVVNYLEKCVRGFGDTLTYFKVWYPGRASYSQPILCQEVLSLQYDAHNATEDVGALRELLDNSMKAPQAPIFSDHCWSMNSVKEDVAFLDARNENVKTLTPLVRGKVLSKCMAQKIGASGLTYGHLSCLYARSGAEGLSVVLSAKVNGKVRVTARKDIISTVCSHFASAKQSTK